jgi:hypothetical protein
MAQIHGEILFSDGSKGNNTLAITTSWNSNRGRCSNGNYSIDLGGNPKQSVEVYVNGTSYGSVHVDGSARKDIRLR